MAVAEGQPVKAGEELFVLRSDEIRGWDTQFKTLSEDLHSKEDSLTRFEAAYAAQLEIKKAEIEQTKSEVKFRENHAATSRDLVTRMEKLAKQGGESEIDLVKLKLDLAGSEKDLSVAQRSLQRVNLDRERIETEHARQRGEQQAEIEKLKMHISALRTDLENTNQNLLTIRSPYEGIITSVDYQTIGSVVQQGQVLCQLAPKDVKPKARITLSEAALAKLAVAQRVRTFLKRFLTSGTGNCNWKARLDQSISCYWCRWLPLHCPRIARPLRNFPTDRTSLTSARWNEGRRAHYRRWPNAR